MVAEQPDVLLILTDQQQAQALGVINDGFKTPNLDKLANTGTLFTGCYTTQPLCSPARASLVTGKYPHQTGMSQLPEWGPGSLNPDLPGVARPFRNDGYETVYIGKWHLGRDNIGAFGWDVTENVHETSNPPEGTPADTTTRDRAIEFLSSRDSESPFFLTVSFNLPHPEYYEDPVFADWYDQEAVRIPESYHDDLQDKPEFHREWATGPKSLTENDVRDIRYRYRTMVSRVDDHIGRILDTLRSRGALEDTIIVFASDHGDMQGAHGLKGKGTVAYDEILRVPLIINLPEHNSYRNRVPDLVSLAGIPGTLLDAAGLPPDEFEGGSLLPALKREAPPQENHVYFEHHSAYGGFHPYRGVRTTEWKYVEYLNEEINELYDMEEDPHEIDNQSGNPKHADTELRLRRMVRRWWENTVSDEVDWRKQS